jgi:hypothetical protein
MRARISAAAAAAALATAAAVALPASPAGAEDGNPVSSECRIAPAKSYPVRQALGRGLDVPTTCDAPHEVMVTVGFRGRQLDLIRQQLNGRVPAAGRAVFAEPGTKPVRVTFKPWGKHILRRAPTGRVRVSVAVREGDLYYGAPENNRLTGLHR